MLGTIVAQFWILFFVRQATKVMDKEWPEKVKAHGEKVLVVHLQPFWGPVHLLIPTHCSEATHWDHELLETQLDCQTAAGQGVGAGFFCIFPATYKGVEYKACIGTDNDRPWCFSDAAAAKLGAGEWAPCAPTCAVDTNATVRAAAHRAEEKLTAKKKAAIAAAARRKEEHGKKEEEKISKPEKRHAEKAKGDSTEDEEKEKRQKKEEEKRRKKEVDETFVHPLKGEAKKANEALGVDQVSTSQDEDRIVKEAAKKDEDVSSKVGVDAEEDGVDHKEDALMKEAAKKEEEATDSKATDSSERDKDSEIVQRQLRSSDQKLPPRADDRELMIIPRHIKNITVCSAGRNASRNFDGPSYWNRYFSMISLSSLITGGTTNMAKLHQSRQLTYRAMFVGLFCTMFLKYSLKLVDLVTHCRGHKYVQLWNGGRTTVDKMLESLMIHGVSIVFTLAMQLTLCTLFLTFWQHEYFVMSYIPGIGFVAFFSSFALFTVLMVYDRVKQVMVQARDRYIYCFWITWAFWMFMVTVPMLGYCVYVMQFVYQVRRGHWFFHEPFSDEFVNASMVMCNAAGMFTTVAIVELLVILKLDLDQGKMRGIA